MNKHETVIYISGKYSAKTPEGIEENIKIAREYAIKVWEADHVALCPHLNTSHFEKDCKCDYQDYIAGDLRLVELCDAILMLPDWQESKGASLELAHALKHKKKVYYSLEELV